MPSQKNILLLTSRTGGGHLSLAEALRELLEEAEPSVDEAGKPGESGPGTPALTIADPQPRLIHQHYRFASRHALWLWAWEFQLLDTPRKALLAHQISARWLMKHLHALLDSVQPDLIISTYPFLTYEVMRVLEQRASQVPLVLLFSDANSLHATWLTERKAPAVLATTQENYAQALVAGFAPDRLHLVGWPVRAQFTRAVASGWEVRQKMHTLLNLAPDRLTVFLQGGSEGTTHIARTLETLLAAHDLAGKLQIILAAGTNHALLERYKQAPHLALVPYTQDIAQYMAAADVIMGKAGPNMLLESVILGKPFLATSYIPGQEQANLSFIQRHRLGWVALRAEEQRALLATLIHAPDHLHDMRATIQAYRQWNAGMNTRIVPLIQAILDAPRVR